MSDLTLLVKEVHDTLEALKPLLDKVDGDKATTQALNDEISSLNQKLADADSKSSTDQLTIDGLAADLKAARERVVAASDTGGSRGGEV